MRSSTFKILVTALLTILFIEIVISVAIVWPMPSLDPPVKHERVFIKSINIIDVTTGKLLKNRDILIEDNRIIRIDSTGKVVPEPNSLQINGINKFAIPGLWDMHTHSTQHSEWLHHPLYIANGVTGIRDMSGQLNERDSYFTGSRERIQWNTELNNNKRVTPRYVLQSSFQMDGAFSIPDGFPEFFKLQNNEDVNALLQFYKNEGVDFIKVYDQIPASTFKKLTEEAPKYGMHVAGHKPIFVSLKDATVFGQRSFEHGRIFLYECFPGADSLRVAKDWKRYLVKSKRLMLDKYDSTLAKELMQLMKEYKAHWCPTIQTLKFEAFAHDSVFLQNPNLKYINYISKKVWWDTDASNNKRRNLSKEGENISLGFLNAAKEQIRVANEIGVPIMAGTDVSDSYIFAGFSLHEELVDLTKCGLTNLQALQSATIVPAKYANLYETHGTIEIGKKADLVILDNNPLEDIANTRTINGVVLNGLYYDANKIKELKSFTESLSLSFHTNVKVLYSLVASPLIRLQWAD